MRHGWLPRACFTSVCRFHCQVPSEEQRILSGESGPGKATWKDVQTNEAAPEFRGRHLEHNRAAHHNGVLGSAAFADLESESPSLRTKA
jgi:hypothetical protein